MTTRLNELESDLIRSMFTGTDTALFEAFANDLSKDTAEYLTKDLDIDSGNYIYMLMLGILGFQKGWDFFPADMTARIRGIHRYEQVKNTSVTPWLNKQIGLLKDNGIEVMFTGNAAMRIAFVPDVPRFLNGYDITVHSKDYDKAAELIRDAALSADKSDFGDRTISGITMIDLHKGVHDRRLFEEESYWNSSAVTEYRSHQVRVPSFEDQLIQCLCIPYAHWMLSENKMDRDYRLVSVIQMLKGRALDLDKLASCAQSAGVSCHLRFQMSVLLPYIDSYTGSDLEIVSDDGRYGTYLDKLIRYRDHASVRNEYQLINTCYRSEEERVSFRRYVADTRNIRSVPDLLRRAKNRSRSSGSEGKKDNGAE